MSMPFKPCLVPVALAILGAGSIFNTPALAQQDKSKLAKQLANPVAALISVPFQLNDDRNIGPDDTGERWTLNIQPVVPFVVNPEWNIILRTIFPLISQEDVFPGAGEQSGSGDTVQSVFFSPRKPAGGWIWGAGPVLLLPTGSEPLLTGDKWGVGPTGVMLQQRGPWTFGGLANHIASFAGSDSRADVNATFLQPFVSYTTPTAWTFTINSKSTYNWETEQWSAPINGVVSKITKIGSQLVSVGAGLRYWVDTPESGPEGMGFWLKATLLFPRGLGSPGTSTPDP